MKEYRLLNKIIALVGMLLLLASCTDTLPSVVVPMQQEEPEGVLYVPYCSSDSLNPYCCAGEVNALLWPLVFLPLYELDSNFTPQPVMAASAVQNDRQLQITINTGLMTAQGVALTVSDVIYSFRLAKESPQYKTQLSVFSDISVGAASDIVVLTLSRPNINACNLLTFPIVQYGTAELESSLPAGAGPYAYVKTDDGVNMTYNPNYYDSKVRTASIELVDSSADASKAFSLKSGRIDCSYSSLADGELLRLSATATTIPMTNLVFLGVNAERADVYSPLVRRAISKLIDRDAITEHAFCGYASPSSLPVHPAWSALWTESVTNYTTADLQAAQNLLMEYETGESELSGEALEDTLSPIRETRYNLTLICCDGNPFKTGTATLIAEQLAAAGIDVRVRELSENAYIKAIRECDYDLYLGEVRMTADMNLSVFLFPGNSLGWGIDNEAITANAVWDSYCAGMITLGEFLNVFESELPFIPLCFRQSIFYSSRSLVNEVQCLPDNVFDNITVWEKENG